MPDVFTKAKRSEVMSRIRSRGNERTEVALIRVFQEQGVVGWRRHVQLRIADCGFGIVKQQQRKQEETEGREMGESVVREECGGYRVKSGKTRRRGDGETRRMPLKVRPDFVFRDRKLAVFVDGCFWHGCAKCYVRPEQNQKFWDAKFARNTERDRKVNRALKAAGWRVLRIWEHELKPKQAAKLVRKLGRVLKGAVGAPHEGAKARRRGEVLGLR